MTQPQRRNNRRGRRPKAVKPLELWKPVPQLPDPSPITPADDPTAVLRSLGDPPLPGQGAVAGHYMAAVVERAAGLAAALAAANGLLTDPSDEDDG